MSQIKIECNNLPCTNSFIITRTDYELLRKSNADFCEVCGFKLGEPIFKNMIGFKLKCQNCGDLLNSKRRVFFCACGGLFKEVKK